MRSFELGRHSAVIVTNNSIGKTVIFFAESLQYEYDTDFTVFSLNNKTIGQYLYDPRTNRPILTIFLTAYIIHISHAHGGDKW